MSATLPDSTSSIDALSVPSGSSAGPSTASAPLACPACQPAPLASISPPVVFRKSRRDCIRSPWPSRGSHCHVVVEYTWRQRLWAGDRPVASFMTSPPKISTTIVSRALASSGLIPFEAKILLGHVLRRDRSWLAAHGDEALTARDAKAFEALARRRRDGGEPVAYLIGRREFYGLDLEITPDV